MRTPQGASGGQQAARGVLEDRFGLGARNAREPGEELVERRAALEVLEQRTHRNARAAEHPRTAHPFRVAINCLAGRPVEHVVILPLHLLNEMDGLGPDARVLFVLTTNRPEVLEPALAGRPERIDQAIEIGLPEDRRTRATPNPPSASASAW